MLRVKAKGQRDLVTVLGSLPAVSAGEWLTATGGWIRDKEHGLQFKATVLKAIPPTTSEGVERYLGGGFVKGVGPVLAKKLVGHFGAEVLGVIGNNPVDLESVDGIGPKRRVRISNAWQEGVQIREIMLFLHSHGVSTGRAVRIYKTYGEQAIEKVRENPYTLAKDMQSQFTSRRARSFRQWSSLWPCSITCCCSATCSTPGSPAPNNCWWWLVRRRLWGWRSETTRRTSATPDC